MIPSLLFKEETMEETHVLSTLQSASVEIIILPLD